MCKNVIFMILKMNLLFFHIILPVDELDAKREHGHQCYRQLFGHLFSFYLLVKLHGSGRFWCQVWTAPFSPPRKRTSLGGVF